MICRILAIVMIVVLADRLHAQTRPTDAEVQSLIDALAEPDPAVREKAAADLLALGSDARAALVRATESDNPQIRSQAGELLQGLPWHRRGDPRPVRKLLADYGKLDVSQRIRVVYQLSLLEGGKGKTAKELLAGYGILDVGGQVRAISRLIQVDRDVGHPALLRLISEEPSAAVRASIVRAMQEACQYGPPKARLRAIDLADGPNVERVLLESSGWRYVDNTRANELILRAVEMALSDLDRPSPRQLPPSAAVAKEMDYLIDDAIALRHFDRAADLMRRKFLLSRPNEDDDDNNDTSGASGANAFELFALHAEHGPLASFGDDLRQYGRRPARREILYVMSRLLGRYHAWPPSRTVASLAFASAEHPMDRGAVAALLARQHWLDWAQLELIASLSDSDAGGDGDASDEKANSIVKVYMMAQLLSVISASKNDKLAATSLEQFLDLINGMRDLDLRFQRSGLSLETPVRTQLHWRRFRIARDQGDDVEAQKHLAEVLALVPAAKTDIDVDIVIELVPILKEQKRDAEAAALFYAGYAAVQAKLEKEPFNPEHMNNLAWLCARCDERLDEAMALATSAIEELPENYAYLDTAAEAHFRNGNAAEAVRLEEKALQIRPNDAFMLEQLERFRAAK